MDTKEIAEVMSVILDEHLTQNGKSKEKNLWLRFAIQLAIAAVVVVTLYLGLRNDVDANTIKIAEECERSSLADKVIDESVHRINLNLNTVKVKQETVMIKQTAMGEDIDEVDEKLDEVLERLP